MTRTLYSWLLRLAFPYVCLRLLLRGLKNRDYWRRLPERFGFVPRDMASVPCSGTVWASRENSDSSSMYGAPSCPFAPFFGLFVSARVLFDFFFAMANRFSLSSGLRQTGAQCARPFFFALGSSGI